MVRMHRSLEKEQNLYLYFLGSISATKNPSWPDHMLSMINKLDLNECPINILDMVSELDHFDFSTILIN